MDANLPDFPLVGLVRLVLAERGADGWQVHESGFWCRIEPPTASRAVQGWKLHVAATVLSAPQVLFEAAQILVDAGCPFKFAADMDKVWDITNGRAERSQCGKFITAYPATDEQFTRLAETLDRATGGFPGPAVLSDRPYRKGSLVHYRYGAFDGVPVLTNDGVHAAWLVDPDGNPYPDDRRAWFAPPPWARLPFDGPPRTVTERPASVLLRDRYLVAEAIQHSARGGVYRAVDRRSGTDVIVKQARAHVDGTYTGTDARDTLRHEAATLKTLSGLGPDLVDLFEQDGHVFLVETVVPGTALSRWLPERLAAADGEHGLPVADARLLADRFAELLAAVHERGIVFRDLTPNNIMVDDALRVRLIDPELAVHRGQSVYRTHTPGYAAPEYLAGAHYGPAPEQATDCYSLGAVLYFLCTGLSPIFAEDRPARPFGERLRKSLTAVAAHRPAARALAPAILGLCEADPGQRWSLATLREHLAALEVASGPEPGPTGPVLPTVDRLLADGLAELLDAIGGGVGSRAGERLFRSGEFGATTDPCSVQHGAAGVLAVLTRASESLDRADLRSSVERVAAWIDARLDTAPRLLPGLYFGRSGTAWALFDAARHLGDDGLAGRAERLALSVPVRWPNPDVFHGAAGAGLTQLHLWHATGRQEFMDRVVACADGLLDAAVVTRAGLTWPVPGAFESSLAGNTYLGFAHGIAGVGTFLLAAALATGRDRYLQAAVAAGEILATTAEVGPWGARWRNTLAGDPGDGLLYHLCSGSSGVATFLVRLWRETGETHLLELSEGAALAAYRARWTSSTVLCHGAAGTGELLLDIADLGDGESAARSRSRAHALVGSMATRHVVRDGRLLLPNESTVDVTMDYGVGLAGTLAFLLRLRHGGPRPFLADRMPAATPVTEPTLMPAGAR